MNTSTSDSNSNSTHDLADLITALQDGVDFYDHAIEKRPKSPHNATYREFHRIKSSIIGDLKAAIALRGERPPSDGSWLSSVREGYADVRAMFVKDSDDSYLVNLEEQEDRVLKAFREALENSDSSTVRDMAAKYLPEVKRMHDQMRALKLAHAA